MLLVNMPEIHLLVGLARLISNIFDHFFYIFNQSLDKRSRDVRVSLALWLEYALDIEGNLLGAAYFDERSGSGLIVFVLFSTSQFPLLALIVVHDFEIACFKIETSKSCDYGVTDERGEDGPDIAPAVVFP
jgi:hypothetical protein